MATYRPSIQDLMATLGANQHSYAMHWEHMHDPFNKHLLHQLANKRNIPMAELNRALLITGCLPLHRSTTSTPVPSLEKMPETASDHERLEVMQHNERYAETLYAELLSEDDLPAGLRRLLQEQLRATRSIVLILAEALRSGEQHAA